MEDNQLVDFTEAYAMGMHKWYETLNKKKIYKESMNLWWEEEK